MPSSFVSSSSVKGLATDSGDPELPSPVIVASVETVARPPVDGSANSSPVAPVLTCTTCPAVPSDAGVSDRPVNAVTSVGLFRMNESLAVSVSFQSD